MVELLFYIWFVIISLNKYTRRTVNLNTSPRAAHNEFIYKQNIM